MSQTELFPDSEVGERKVLPPAARATAKHRATPAPVGSGPAGETCKTCRHYALVKYHDYTHRKCGLMKSDWTHGPGTDITASYAACRAWEEPVPPSEGVPNE